MKDDGNSAASADALTDKTLGVSANNTIIIGEQAAIECLTEQAALHLRFTMKEN